MMEIDYTKRFIKQLRKAPQKVQLAFRKRVNLFVKDKFDPVLKNHALKGEYLGYRSINVTGDWRALFMELKGGKLVSFELLDTHSNLYG